MHTCYASAQLVASPEDYPNSDWSDTFAMKQLPHEYDHSGMGNDETCHA